ncbi:hypothetical protein [Streptomyces fradiae]|uniref:hypothetical protein n=1 Tax=Streptomyces fradiae TaxID=1906 RepID=UPI0035BE9335
MSRFDETKLIVDTGIAHGRLGGAATAEPLIADALRRENSTDERGRAVQLARTQLSLGKSDAPRGSSTASLMPLSISSQHRRGSPAEGEVGQIHVSLTITEGACGGWRVSRQRVSPQNDEG